MKEGYFLCARHGGRADVGIKEQLELDMRQTHVGENTQPYGGYERCGSLERYP